MDRRVIYLFPKVVEILAPRYAQSLEEVYRENAKKVIDEVVMMDVSLDDDDDEGAGDGAGGTLIDAWNDGDDEELGPDWYYPIRMTGILTMRLVCSAWNEAIQTFYQGPLTSNYKMDHDLDPGIHGQWSRTDYCTNHVFNFTVPHLPNKFIQHFEQSHFIGCDDAPKKNPFLGRAVTFKQFQLELYPVANSFIFFQGMFRILTKYGSELWYCTIDLLDKMPTSADFYFQLRKWLQLMPNLKVLNIVYQMQRLMVQVDPDSPVAIRLVVDQPISQDLVQLESEVTRNPLPKLMYLEMLQVKDLPTSVFNQLMLRNCHISRLEICSGEEEIHEIHGIFTLPLPGLSQLSFPIFKPSVLGKLEENGFSWKLEKVYVLCCHEFFQWSRLMQLLTRNWSSTLTNLVVQLPFPKTAAQKMECLEESYTYRLGLPQLQRLKIIVGVPCSLDFILPTRETLKFVHVVAKYDSVSKMTSTTAEYQAVREKQIVKFLGFEGKMMTSNIWALFRKLKLIKMELIGEQPWLYSDTVYTREKSYRLE